LNVDEFKLKISAAEFYKDDLLVFE